MTPRDSLLRSKGMEPGGRLDAENEARAQNGTETKQEMGEHTRLREADTHGFS